MSVTEFWGLTSRLIDRPGSVLVDCCEVGLPVYRVNCVALLLDRKPLDAIQEYVLRTVEAGISSVDAVSNFLGLPSRTVDDAVTELIREGALGSQNDGEKLAITDSGRKIAADAGSIQPHEQTLVFTFDGLTRKTKWYGETVLYTPHELREAGIPEIPASPARGPELNEIILAEVANFLELSMGRKEGRREQPRQLLQIKSVERRVRLFQRALALLYRTQRGSTNHVSFVADGRLSEEHELAVARANLFDKASLFCDVEAPLRVEQLAKLLDDKVVSQLVRRVRDALTSTSDVVPEIESREHVDVGPLDCPTMLIRALDDADHRVLIVAPGTSRRVVDNVFIKSVERQLSRGVKIWLVSGGDGDANDRETSKEFLAIGKRHSGFCYLEIPGLDVSLLAADMNLLIVSRHSWLSYVGDRRRRLRDVRGVLVREPGVVEDVFRAIATWHNSSTS